MSGTGPCGSGTFPGVPGSTSSRVGSAGTCWFILVPAGFCWFILVPAGCSCFMLVPTGSSGVLLVPGGTCWLLVNLDAQTLVCRSSASFRSVLRSERASGRFCGSSGARAEGDVHVLRGRPRPAGETQVEGTVSAPPLKRPRCLHHSPLVSPVMHPCCVFSVRCCNTRVGVRVDTDRFRDGGGTRTSHSSAL